MNKAASIATSTANTPASTDVYLVFGVATAMLERIAATAKIAAAQRSGSPPLNPA
jgi:hypothetical protein